MSVKIGGKEISAMTRDELELALRERLQVNCGLIAENAELRKTMNISGGAQKITRSRVEKAISGALKSALDAHGPVTAENRTSAAKRIYGVLRGEGYVPPDGSDVYLIQSAATPEE